MPGTKGGLWTYRRLIDRGLFAGSISRTTSSMFNWPGNDYRDRSILDCVAARAWRAALQDAKRVSLGFLHWLQTEAPADGEPARRARAPAAARRDGHRGRLSQVPLYPRVAPHPALKTIVEQEVSAALPAGSARRALRGLGRHRLVSDRHPSLRARRRRRQLPDRAVPDPARRADSGARATTCSPAAKNIGTTHITNGCYRLHPVEWNIGEAAGALAAFCLDQGKSAAAVHRDAELRSAFQRSLLDEGVPLAWTINIGVGDKSFAQAQWRAMQHALAGLDDLTFSPERSV